MAAANVLHALAIALGLQSILKTAHVDAGLKAKACTIGDLRRLPVNSDGIKAKMPLIIVHPLDESFIKTALGMSGRWEATIPFRIYYAGLVETEDGEDALATKMAAAQSIVCTLLDNFKLTGVTLQNGTVQKTEIDRVEYSPSEEVWVNETRGDIFCLAIAYKVVVTAIVNS